MYEAISPQFRFNLLARSERVSRLLNSNPEQDGGLFGSTPISTKYSCSKV
jgi:hypothetical protein